MNEAIVICCGDCHRVEANCECVGSDRWFRERRTLWVRIEEGRAAIVALKAELVKALESEAS